MLRRFREMGEVTREDFLELQKEFTSLSYKIEELRDHVNSIKRRCKSEEAKAYLEACDRMLILAKTSTVEGESLMRLAGYKEIG